MDDDDGIIQDDLAVGLTRPSMIWPGVTYYGVIINIVISTEAIVLSGNVLRGLIFFPIHGLCYLVCLKEPRAFDLLVAWGRTKGHNLLLTRRYWKASSSNHLAMHKPPGWISRFKFWRLTK